LVVNVTSADLTPSIQNYVVSSYHTGAGQAAAVLTDPSVVAGRNFYVNGTAEDVYYRTSNILTDGGTPPFPSGLIVQPDDSASNLALINAGLGTTGVGLTRFPVPVTTLEGPGYVPTTYYACVDETLPYGPAVGLYYAYSNDTLPEGCVPIVLLPQCAEDDGVEHEFGNTVTCYADVAGIDWTIYSAA
jgi:hypothetical protein